MEQLSKEYGWTPTEIRNLSVQDINDYIEIISIRNQLEKAQAKKARRK